MLHMGSKLKLQFGSNLKLYSTSIVRISLKLLGDINYANNAQEISFKTYGAQ